MLNKYKRIRTTPAFLAAYAELRTYLRKSSPMAYMALAQGMTAILDLIDDHPRGWPLKRKNIGGDDLEFHLAIVSVAYRRLHVRYHVDDQEVSYLLAVWVDGHDEPLYVMED